MYLDGQELVRRGGVDDAAASNCAATSASAEAAVERVRAIGSARIRAMKPIASADICRFMASPDGSLLAELASRYGLGREKFDIESRSATLY